LYNPLTVRRFIEYCVELLVTGCKPAVLITHGVCEHGCSINCSFLEITETQKQV